MGRWLGLVLAAAAALPAAPSAVRAQVESREGIALQNQILELRHQLEALQAGRATGGSVLGGQATSLAPPPAAAGSIDAQLLDRVQRLEDAVRELRGRIDDAQNTRQQQYDALNKKIDDLAFRLDGGGASASRAAAAPAAPAAPPAVVPTPPPPPPPPAAATGVKRTPELILQEGTAALGRRDYALAETDAREVLAAKSTHMADAQFLLAQALAGKKDYSAAAVAFDDAYNRSRTGARAPDSLLGLANALVAINEKRAACETLDKLRAEFPNPRADLKEPIAAARKSAACK
jgi:TolA-binding protein